MRSLVNTGRATRLLATLFMLVGCGKQPEQELKVEKSALTDPTDADYIDKSLMILDPSVVDAPQAQSRLDNPASTGVGIWSFGGLLQGVSGSADPRDTAEQLLNQLASGAQVNGFSSLPTLSFFAQPNPNVFQEALDHWCRTPDGKLDLAKAPFRLLAIVNRPDLRQSASEAGELRFIFNMLKTDDSCAQVTDTEAILPAVTGSYSTSIIFEFEQPTDSCTWNYILAYYWRYLATQPFGDYYNSFLGYLTQRTTGAQNPNRPNGSQLKQVRTNTSESPSQWTLREFKLGGLSPDLSTQQNPLQLAPPAAVPDFGSFNDSPELATFLEERKLEIASGRLSMTSVPATYLNRPFGGAESKTIQQWQVSGVGQPDFTVQTCGGCHNHGASGPHVGVPAFFGSSFLGREVGTRAGLSFFVAGGFFAGEGDLVRRAALLKQVTDWRTCATVDALSSPSSFDPTSTDPGGSVYVNSTAMAPAPDQSANVLRLYRAGDPDSAPLGEWPLPSTSALTTSSVPLPATPGVYEVRLFTAYGPGATSRPLTVKLNLHYQAYSATFVPRGGSFFYGWSSPVPHDGNDWLALYPAGADSSAPPVWTAPTGTGMVGFDGSFVNGWGSTSAPSQPGQYELRYLRAGSGIVTAVGSPITVQ